MSGTPKYSSPSLSRRAQDDVMRLVARELARAAERRRQAVERERRENERRLQELARWRAERERALQAEMEARRQEAERAREEERQRALARAEEQRRRLEEERRRAALRAEAEQAVASASDAVAGLCEDPIVTRWQGAEAGELRDRIAVLRAELDADRCESVAEAARAIERELPAIDEAARTVEEAATRRQYIASGIAESLAEMGFTVSAQSLEHPAYPQSALVFEARRVSGATVSVSVPIEGDVWYSVDGYPMRLESRSSGGEAPTCDEAQSEIAAMHAVLEERFGVQMGELSWEGKDPHRLLRQADDFDIGGGASARGGRQL